eukprot:scaffold338194_cov79-Cyclotella_meneghiniana.AAC.1
MDATLFWNITCPLNGTAEEVANIISQSVYDGTVEETDGLQYVYVYELCGEQVSSTPYPPGRRLQAGESAIRLKSIITSTCNGCEDDMFNQAEEALRKIVEDGSLSQNIQDNSGDEITAVINTTITDTSSEVITNPPTAAPANPTTEAPIASRKITETPTLSPITSAPTPCEAKYGTPCIDSSECFCAGLECVEDTSNSGSFICATVDDSPSLTYSPVSSPLTNRPTTSKSSKDGKKSSKGSKDAKDAKSFNIIGSSSLSM